MARFRVGPVRFGGGRRASLTVNAGPVGVTLGGRRRRSSSGGGGGGYSDGSSYGGPSAAEIREMEREQRAYERWYNSLTQAERRVVDQREWENNATYWAESATVWSGLLRIGFLSYWGVVSLFLWILFIWNFPYLLFLLVAAVVANLVYSTMLIPRLKPVIAFFDSRPFKVYVIFWVSTVTVLSVLLIKLPSFDQWLSTEGEGGIVGFASYSLLGWMLMRRWMVKNLRLESAEVVQTYNRMVTAGVLDQSLFLRVSGNLNVLALTEDAFSRAKYLTIAAWRPERIVRGRRLGMLRYTESAGEFESEEPRPKKTTRRRKKTD